MSRLDRWRDVLDLEIVDAIAEVNATLAGAGMRLASDHWSCWTVQTGSVPPRPARPNWSATWVGAGDRRVECTLVATGLPGEMWRTVLVAGGMVCDGTGATWVHDPGSAMAGHGATAGQFADRAARLLT
jgi:hypothetical protein